MVVMVRSGWPTGIVLYVCTVVYSWYGLESPPQNPKYFPQFFCTLIFLNPKLFFYTTQL